MQLRPSISTKIQSFIFLTILLINPNFIRGQESIPDTIRTRTKTIIGHVRKFVPEGVSNPKLVEYIDIVSGESHQIYSTSLVSVVDGSTGKTLYPALFGIWNILLNNGEAFHFVYLDSLTQDTLFVRATNQFLGISLEDLSEIRKIAPTDDWRVPEFEAQQTEKIPNWTLRGAVAGAVVLSVSYGLHPLGIYAGGIFGGIVGLGIHVVALATSPKGVSIEETSPKRGVYLLYNLSRQNKYGQLRQIMHEEKLNR